MVSSLRLRLPCRDLTLDSAACTSVEWSAALAARTAASRSSTWFHTAFVYVIALLGCAGLHFRCIPDANGASQEQITHPRCKKCIPGAAYASQMQKVHPRSRLRIPDAKSASQEQILHPRCSCESCQSSFSLALQMTQGRLPSACIVKTLSLQMLGLKVDIVLSQHTWCQQCVGVT